MSSIGQVLGDTRRRAGIPLEQAAWATRLREDYLDALERDDIAHLGLDAAYVRGTVRTYAEYLGLDSQSLVARHRQAASGVAAGGRARRRTSRTLAVVAGVIVFAAAAVVAFGSISAGWRLPWTLAGETAADDGAVTDDPTADGGDVAVAGASGVASTDTTAMATDEVPGSEPSADAGDDAAADDEQEFFAAESDEPLTLKLKVTGYVWMRVVVDGETVLEGLYDDGFAERFTADESIDLRLGVGGNVEFTINGVWYGPLGQGTNGPLNLRCDRTDGCRVLEPPG